MKITPSYSVKRFYNKWIFNFKLKNLFKKTKLFVNVFLLFFFQFSIVVWWCACSGVQLCNGKSPIFSLVCFLRVHRDRYEDVLVNTCNDKDWPNMFGTLGFLTFLQRFSMYFIWTYIRIQMTWKKKLDRLYFKNNCAELKRKRGGNIETIKMFKIPI